MRKRSISPHLSIPGKNDCGRSSRAGVASRHDLVCEKRQKPPPHPDAPELGHQLKRQQEPLEGLWHAWRQTLEQWRLHGRGVRDGPEAANLKLLSPRERQVLDWMESGKSVDETAVILGISPRTVEKHRQNLRAKLRPAENPQQP